MNKLPPPDAQNEQWENDVRDTAREFSYPPTPNIAAGVRRQQQPRPMQTGRRLRWAAAILLLVMTAALTVPEVRAWVLEIIRIGAIQIVPVEPTATPTMPTITRTPTRQSAPLSDATPLLMTSVLELSGATTLAAARETMPFAFLVPTYPADLGEPDQVFVNDWGGEVVTLVWLRPDDPTQVWLTLEALNASVIGTKYYPQGEEERVQVNGQRSYWLTDVHGVNYFTRNQHIERRITQSVLIWIVEGITYRLETDFALAEAVRVAESLR
ncbi:MAG: hypothetical protein H7X77_09085 [Anaerolineae bacterium]|nr:hypothetical protein [Anaerolineae bacterium]